MFEASIHYSSKGRRFAGFLAEPETDRAAGVLVLHGGAGLGEHERERARRLAGLGYAALAPDLFGEVFRDRAHGMAVIRALVDEPEILRARLADALSWLRGRKRVDPARLAAIGFCFGGLAALELARAGAPLRAVVSFHGGLATTLPAAFGRMHASVLVCTGAEDPHVPLEQRAALEAEMRATGADWALHVHGGAQHAFTVRDVRQPGCAYHPNADRRSWEAMKALFAERLG